MNQEWMAWEAEYLRRYYYRKGSAYCAYRLKRTAKATQQKANKLGLKRRAKKESMCWDCGKFATGSKKKCPWKWDDIPIPGWVTKPGVYGGIAILDCPEFEEWKR